MKLEFLRNLGGGKDSILIPMPDDYEMQGWAYNASDQESYITTIIQKCKDIQINDKKYTFKEGITLDDYFIISLTTDGYNYQASQNLRAINNKAGDLIPIAPCLWRGNKIDAFSPSGQESKGTTCLDKFLEDCILDNLSYSNNSFLLTLVFQDGTDYFDNRQVYIDLSKDISNGIEMQYDNLTYLMNGQYKLWINLLLE